MSDTPTLSVGTYEARTHFSELLGRVEQGDEITITRHGVPIAYLIPAHRKPSSNERRAAIQALRQLAKEQQLGKSTIQDLIREGRR